MNQILLVYIITVRSLRTANLIIVDGFHIAQGARVDFAVRNRR